MPGTDNYRLPTDPAVSMSSNTLRFGRCSTPEEMEQLGRPLSVRNPDPKDEAKIPNSPSFQPGVDDASYFNHPTGIDISAVPIVQEPPAFALAKTYSDLSTPPFLGDEFAIPTSPDLSEQTSRSFAARAYSKSPLSKSPGKGFMGKMVGAAKKMKNRTGNVNRLLYGDLSATTGPLPKQRIDLNETSTISLVPSAIQRQEQLELQPHWGQEDYLRQGGSGQIDPATQGFPVTLPPLPKERELPVSSI
jgi:hypothetical protein